MNVAAAAITLPRERDENMRDVIVAVAGGCGL